MPLIRNKTVNKLKQVSNAKEAHILIYVTRELAYKKCIRKKSISFVFR